MAEKQNRQAKRQAEKAKAWDERHKKKLTPEAAAKQKKAKVMLLVLTLLSIVVTLYMMFVLYDQAYAGEVSRPEAIPIASSTASAIASPQIVGQSMQDKAPFDLHALYSSENPPKGVVLNFYSTTCIPCIREAPDFNELTKQYQPKGIHFYYVNVEANAKPQRLESFIRRLEVVAPMILADAMQVRKDYNAYAMPKAVILDGLGNLAYAHEGYDPTLKATLSAELDKLLP